jgi:hypothetical protein
MSQIIYPQVLKIGGWLRREKRKCRIFRQKATNSRGQGITVCQALEERGPEQDKPTVAELEANVTQKGTEAHSEGSTIEAVGALDAGKLFPI